MLEIIETLGLNMAFISVVIPTYNRRHTLKRAFDSVRHQTRPADEIICVDDGSTDGTRDLVPVEYPDIAYLREPHRGVSAARNAGIRYSRGEWIAFLDSDDAWMPRKLERQKEKMPGFRVVHTDEIWIRNGRRINPAGKHRKQGGRVFSDNLPFCKISPSSVLIHRSVFDTVGLFDESLPACEDYDLWLRMSCHYEVGYIDEPLVVKYGGHADQLSRLHWGMDRFRIRSLSRLIEEGRLAEEDRKRAVAVLREKCDIYIQGALKRKKSQEVRTYREIRERHPMDPDREGEAASEAGTGYTGEKNPSLQRKRE